MKSTIKVPVTAPGNFDFAEKLAVHDILLPKPDEIEKYLSSHEDLGPRLDAMCNTVRAAFGPPTELALAVYEDPETDDRYLTLYVRQESYEPDILERIEAVSARIHPQLEATTGYVLITTDFRRPGGVHAV